MSEYKQKYLDNLWELYHQREFFPFLKKKFEKEFAMFDDVLKTIKR
jgi:hypothetical protein